jgi:hypothetical protein
MLTSLSWKLTIRGRITREEGVFKEQCRWSPDLTGAHRTRCEELLQWVPVIQNEKKLDKKLILHLKFLFLKKKMCFRLTVQNGLIQSVGF